MIHILAISSFVCFLLSWVLNLLLLFCLIYHNSAQNNGYRRISLAIVVFDLLFSAAYAITVPLWHSDGHALLLLIPVGYTSTLPSGNFLNWLIRPSFVIWHAGMITTSFLVAATFAYRYTVICNSQRLKSWYYSKILRTVILLFCTTFALTQGLLLDRVMEPIDKLTATMNHVLQDVYGVDFTQVYYQGSDLSDPDMSSRGLVGMAMSGVFQLSFVAIIFVVFYTGSKMHTVIRRNTISHRAQAKHQQVFRMLVCQALSPFLFLYLPPLIDATCVTIGYYVPLPICIAKAFLVYLFPIANPLAILIFTDDYRYFIRNSKQRIKSENSIN
ncbi:hypothetical protein PFISCL1PPCAC_11171, partial [Pristionchus fissidentatus]